MALRYGREDPEFSYDYGGQYDPTEILASLGIIPGSMPAIAPEIRPGNPMDAPTSEQRLNALLGIESPEMAQPDASSYQSGPFDAVLEQMAARGVPQGLQNPQGFWQGLVSGGAQGLAGAGQKLAQRRAKFEQEQAKRNADRDAENRVAMRDYRNQRVSATRELVKSERESAVKQKDYERDNPQVTPEMVKAQPELGRLVGQRVPMSWLKPEARKQTPAEIEAEAYARAKGTARAEKEIPKPGTGKEKPPTAAQQQASAFYNRASNALSTIDKPGKSGSLEERIAKSGWLAQSGLRGPNALQNPDQRRYNQAVREFSIALLRKESGAAISQSEYDSIAKTYFVQPGDDPETIKSKRQARKVALEGMKLSTAPSSAEGPDNVEDWDFSGGMPTRIR